MRQAEDRIIEYLRFAPEAGRGALAAELGLPEPTVTTAVRKLLAAGRVVAATAPPAGPGRPRQVLRLAGPPPRIGLVTWEMKKMKKK